MTIRHAHYRRRSHRRPIHRPILGILVKEEVARMLPDVPEISDVNLHMNGANQVGITAYLFTLNGVDRLRRKIQAWVRGADGRWKREVMPWPDVLYEYGIQIISKSQWGTLKDLRSSTICINSARALGKWRCHRILRRYTETRDLLPETVNHRRITDLAKMLAKHQAVLAKPELGSAGEGISKVWRAGNNRFGWKDSVTARERSGLTLSQAHRLILRTASYQPFVIQQRLPLLQVDGRLMDIRLFMYKNRQGEWFASAPKARIGALGQFVTNKHRGGEPCELKDALLRAGMDEPSIQDLTKRLEYLAKVILRKIERDVGQMGEIGLDLALDKDMRLWFIEANARPEKLMPETMPSPDHVPPQFASTSEYALYLWEHRRRRR